MHVDLTQLTGKLLELAKAADNNSVRPNGIYLDTQEEISLFLGEAKKAVESGEVTCDDVNRIFGLEKTTVAAAPESESSGTTASTYVEKFSREQKEQVTYITEQNTNNELSEMAHNLDSLLIENEITGLGYLLNRLPNYDLNELADKYKDIQDKFNRVDYEAEYWYGDPDTEKPAMEEKLLFEQEAEKILGMPYEEFAAAYPEELAEVAEIPPIIRGVSSIAEIILHEQAVAKLSESALAVYRKISDLNSVLAVNFNAWENDIMYKATQKTSEMSMDVIMDLDIVEANEYAYSIGGEIIGFEMPQNWLVKKHFNEAIEQVRKEDDGEGESSGINDVQADTSSIPYTQKVIKDGKFLIEKTYPDGTKEYYNFSGIRAE